MTLEALSNLKANSYDLVLLAKMNGYELYDKMKKIDTKVKVCFMSAYDMKSDPLQEQFGSLQIECFISKPIEISDLIKILETELLRLSRRLNLTF
jgi:CheY-like chemotaxis protein